MELQEWLIAGIPLIVGGIVVFLVQRFRGPLVELKKLFKGQPIAQVFAAAAVMIAEAIWTDYEGEVQFEKACEMVAEMLYKRLGYQIAPEQIEVLVQTAYDTLKKVCGEQWEGLGLSLSVLLERP